MKLVQNINGLSGISPINTNEIQLINPAKGSGKSFGELLKSALNEVSKVEQTSNRKAELLAQGKIDDLHDVMISAQKANITVEAAVQVQQKVIDTYNEMMRMQV